jgi:transposase-like protein
VDEREQQRKIRHRLAILRHAEEVTGDVSATCRYYGISRPTFYKWLHRFEELGEEGLGDRSSAPHRCPTATPTEIVGKVL